MPGDGGVLHTAHPHRDHVSTPLQRCYDRSTVTVNANVAPATHGETVSEIAGSGEAAGANQSFPLKQGPLTYVSSPASSSGASSTLQVRINDLLWDEARTLYGRGAIERIYAVRQDDDGHSAIKFGDGEQGRAPAERTEQRAAHLSQGARRRGNLRVNQITMLLTRPLGVKGVTNPARRNRRTGRRADLAMRERTRRCACSRSTARYRVQDYVDFARAFAGIAKAFGVWIADGRARGVYLTVAGPGGAKISADSDTLKHLTGALRRFGDVHLPLSVQTYKAATFRLQAKIKVADDAEDAKVLSAVESALRADFSFETREFGQPVTIDEVYASIHRVSGVVAADINKLYRKGQSLAPSSRSPKRGCSPLSRWCSPTAAWHPRSC